MAKIFFRCPTPGPVMVGIQKDEKKGKLWRVNCSRWSCEFCAAENAKEWAFVAFYGASELTDEFGALAFITMTSHEKLSVPGTLAVWPDAWKKLHSRLSYRHGKGEYFMVPERHKSMKLHMHAICTWGVDEHWLKDNARACGLGYIAHVRPVDHPVAAMAYASKYLTKFGHAWPKGWRRVRLSRGWPKPTEPGQPEGWQYWVTKQDPELLVNMVADYATAGYTFDVQRGLLEC